MVSSKLCIYTIIVVILKKNQCLRSISCQHISWHFIKWEVVVKYDAQSFSKWEEMFALSLCRKRLSYRSWLAAHKNHTYWCNLRCSSATSYSLDIFCKRMTAIGPRPHIGSLVCMYIWLLHPLLRGRIENRLSRNWEGLVAKDTLKMSGLFAMSMLENICDLCRQY